MAFRDKLRRLERASEELVVSIPQPGGSDARFPESQLADAFLTTTRRLCGEDVPPHPLALAASRSPSSAWNLSLYADTGDPVTVPEDLSE